MAPAKAVGSLTLHDFLVGLFPAHTDHRSIHLCYFPGDPHNKLHANWQGFRHKPFPYELPDDANQYFCVGLLDPRSVGRSGAAVIASPIVGLDDVGTKVPFDLVRTLLTEHGVRPNAVVETSPRNFSLYYSTFDGNAHQMAALRDRIKELGLSDPATQDPARYMRLPFGINGKGRGDWRVRLVRWAPGHVVPFADWEAALWPGEGAGAAIRTHLRRGLLTGDLDRMARMDDPLVQLAAEVGLNPEPIRPGVIGADCPFGDDHTGGDLSGFAFINWGRCHCHHGHCTDRNSGDFREKMVELYDAQIAVGLLDGTFEVTTNDTMVRRHGDGELIPASGHGFLSARAFDLAGDAEALMQRFGDPEAQAANIAAGELSELGEFGNDSA